MGEVVVYVEELQSSCAVFHCRICHEAEFESCRSLESPCSCSGTVQFAHRDCIQRWCNEKGNTTCEICLQNYEPEYTATSKLNDVMTVRESSEILRAELELETEGNEGATAYGDCSSATDRSVAYCRSLALTLTVVMVVKEMMGTITAGTQGYPFTLPTILVLRCCGILLPMFLLFKTVSALRKSARRQYQDIYYEGNEDNTPILEAEEQHLI